MKTTIKSIATVALALGILGTSAFASGGRGTSVDFKTTSKMKMSKPAGMSDAKNQLNKAVIKSGQPNR